MQIKVFEISTCNQVEDEERLNAFLRTHKILKVDKEFYFYEGVGRWTLLVSYMENLPSSMQLQSEKKPKIDYKQVLNDDIFLKFSRLRELRKRLAMDDAVPAYAVFTDAELAEIAKLENIIPSELHKINGIGDKRVEKYGIKLCKLYNEEIISG